MQKTIIALTGVVVGLLTAFLVLTLNSPPAAAEDSQAASYAEERALIENLQARYLFALDFKDFDTYVSTFTPDGILDVGNGEVDGQWLFAKRRIYNEGNEAWAAPPGNAAW